MRKKVLMVCLGNICRSPTAEAVLKFYSKKHSLELVVDSAGTSAYHAGESSDARSIKHAEKRNYVMNHLSRQLTQDDFKNFDYILTMDNSNYNNTLRVCPEEHKYKIEPITKYSKKFKISEIPDPYSASADGFELVLDYLEDCVEGFVLDLKGE